jgi:hypothetical protein
VLEVTKRVLGKEHPDTSVSAWNLCNTLYQLDEMEAALKVFANNLAWLHECDPADLSADQREIRDYLK